MVSASFTAFLFIALAAISQVVLASPSYPPPCKEFHPKAGVTRTHVAPWFTPAKTSNVIRKQWKATDGTRVQVKHLFQNDGTLLLIKSTKDRQEKRVELSFRVNGNQSASRYFRVKKDHTCYVPTKGEDDAMGLQMVSYYRKNT